MGIFKENAKIILEGLQKPTWETKGGNMSDTKRCENCNRKDNIECNGNWSECTNLGGAESYKYWQPIPDKPDKVSDCCGAPVGEYSNANEDKYFCGKCGKKCTPTPKPEAEGDALDNILSQFMCPEDAADYKVMIRKALTGDIVDEFVERLLKNVQTTNILTPNHGNSWVSKKDILEIARQAKGSANEQAEQEV